MREKPPLVSVVMSVYNGERFLRESIESILNQTFTDFEFIIIDDGSTDGTSDILSDYQKLDHRMKIYRQENQGLTLSLTKGLQYTGGQYIARMDCGDISLPHRFARQVQFLEQHHEIGLVGSGYNYIGSSGEIQCIWQPPEKHGVLKWELCFHNPIPHSLVMMRTEVLSEINGYNQLPRFAQDYNLWCRLSDVTQLSCIKDILFQVRTHEGTDISSLYSKEQREYRDKVSQMMMKKILGEDVSLEIIRSILDKKINSHELAWDSSKLIINLYKSYILKNKLNDDEIKLIRRDTAGMLWNISRPRLQDISMWKFLGWACILNPLFIFSILKAPFRRLNPKFFITIFK